MSCQFYVCRYENPVQRGMFASLRFFMSAGNMFTSLAAPSTRMCSNIVHGQNASQRVKQWTSQPPHPWPQLPSSATKSKTTSTGTTQFISQLISSLYDTWCCWPAEPYTLCSIHMTESGGQQWCERIKSPEWPPAVHLMQKAASLTALHWKIEINFKLVLDLWLSSLPRAVQKTGSFGYSYKYSFLRRQPGGRIDLDQNDWNSNFHQ